MFMNKFLPLRAFSKRPFIAKKVGLSGAARIAMNERPVGAKIINKNQEKGYVGGIATCLGAINRRTQSSSNVISCPKSTQGGCRPRKQRKGFPETFLRVVKSKSKEQMFAC
jgi:hypothetical protein